MFTLNRRPTITPRCPIARAVGATLDALEPRRLMANDPLTVSTLRIGTAAWLNVVGTAGDDAIVITQTAKTSYSITNGTWSTSRTGTFLGVRVAAGAGNDSVTISGPWGTRTSLLGEAGDDTLTGGVGVDSLLGGTDNDALTGNGGNDYLYGELGLDTLSGGVGNDIVNGGAGDDLLNGNDGNDKMSGVDGNDTLSGGLGFDSLNGGIGDDSLDGGDGNDALTGDVGNDSLVGGTGNDTLNGTAGNDLLTGNDGNDIVSGSDGLDTLAGNAGNDSMNGGTGDDSIDGADGNDTLIGDLGNDTLLGGTGNDWLGGYAGNDSIDAGANDDRVIGTTDSGNDSYVGGTGLDQLDYTGRLVALTLTLDGQSNDGAAGETDHIPDDFESIFGGNGHDSMVGNDNSNALYGGLGNDTINGNGGNDRVYGGNGLDSILGGAGNDSLWGQADHDRIFGDDGDDFLEGGMGNDAFFGGDGRDRLIALGGGLLDSLTGGDGLDSYWLDVGATEQLLDLSEEETTARAQHRVAAFVRAGATVVSKEITGQKLPEPVGGTKVVNFRNNKLFADSGPSMNDIAQGQTGDCWYLASLSAIAKVAPEQIRQAITDLGDGTYAVRFFASGKEQYVRVDADLHTYTWSNTVQLYARTGSEGSLWAPLMEKALTWVRGSRLGTYATISSGWMSEANARLGIVNAHPSSQETASVGAMVSYLQTQLAANRAVTFGTGSVQAGVRLIGGHAYTVDSVIDNGDGTFGIVCRNPWGYDGTGTDSNTNDGYVTLTAAEFLANCGGITSGVA